MTTPATGRKLTSACNGVTKNFACPTFINDGDLQVYLLTSASQPLAAGTRLNEGADYTIHGDPRAGTATITTTIAYPVGKWICRYRVSSRAQSNDYVPNDGFPADSHEQALDRLSLIDEEHDDGETAAVRAPAPENLAPLPSAADRADRVMAFDDNGDPYVPNVSASNLETLAGVAAAIAVVAANIAAVLDAPNEAAAAVAAKLAAQAARDAATASAAASAASAAAIVDLTAVNPAAAAAAGSIRAILQAAIDHGDADALGFLRG